MSDTLASFRELKGIGPAIEAKLHEAGVHTWEALAEIVNALGNVRGSTGDTLRELSESIAARAAEPAPVPVETTSKPPAPAESRDHVVVLDVGKAVGGSRRNLEWVVSTARLTDISEFEYQATLTGRAYGQTPEKWATLAGHTGSGHPPDSLQLRFEAVELPPGVQRLRLQLALRLPSPKEARRHSSSGSHGSGQPVGAGLPAQPAPTGGYSRGGSGYPGGIGTGGTA